MNPYFTKVGESTSEECHKRWRSIRDRYVRETKKVKKRRNGDPGVPYTPVWELYDNYVNIPQGPDQTLKVS